MAKKLLVAGLAGMTFGLSTPFAIGVAQAGCTGSPVTHNWRCDCNPGSYWDPAMGGCHVTQDWIDTHQPSGPWPIHTCQTASCAP